MSELLPILAIETSDSICSAALFYSKEKCFSAKITLKHSHSEKLFEVIETVISEANIKKDQIKSIAVSSGPGSFTGLRIGMAAAKGLSQSLNIPLFLVPTFEALALQIANLYPEKFEFIIANKVGKDEVYFAKFQIIANNYIFKQELKIIPITELKLLTENLMIFGNVDFNSLGLTENVNSLSSPDAEQVAYWASLFGKSVNATEIDYLEPNYLKDFVIKEKKI